MPSRFHHIWSNVRLSSTLFVAFIMAFVAMPEGVFAQTTDITMLPPTIMGTSIASSGLCPSYYANPTTTSPQLLFYTGDTASGHSAINCSSSSSTANVSFGDPLTLYGNGSCGATAPQMGLGIMDTESGTFSPSTAEWYMDAAPNSNSGSSLRIHWTATGNLTSGFGPNAITINPGNGALSAYGGGTFGAGFVGINITTSTCPITTAKYMLDVGPSTFTGDPTPGGSVSIPSGSGDTTATTIHTDGAVRFGSRVWLAGDGSGTAWIGLRGLYEDNQKGSTVPIDNAIGISGDSSGRVAELYLGNNLAGLSRSAGGAITEMSSSLYTGGPATICGGSLGGGTKITVGAVSSIVSPVITSDCKTDAYTLDVSSNSISNGYIAAGAYFHNSDARLKTDIHPITGALDKLLSIQGVSFNWKNNGKPSMGVVAQNVADVFPDVVTTGKDGMMSVQYDTLIGPMIEAIRELKTENDTLKQNVSELDDVKAQMTEIRATLNALKQENSRLRAIKAAPEEQVVKPSAVQSH